MRFNQGIHNILVERGIASENTAMLFMCFYGAIRQTNMATDSFNIYLSPVGVKSLNRFVINWQAGAKLIRHVHEYNGFVTLNASTIKNVMTCLKGTRGYMVLFICSCCPGWNGLESGWRKRVLYFGPKVKDSLSPSRATIHVRTDR